METFILRIKNMVCPRCIKVVRESLENMGMAVTAIELGQVQVRTDTLPDLAAITQCLEKEGFELIENDQKLLIESVKIALIRLIHSGKIENLKGNFSAYVASAVQKDYHAISVAFSAAEGITLEKFFIRQKVERAKELLSYGEMNLGSLAHKLGYSSIAHFSNQFKQITGVSPTQYRKSNLPAQNRKFIDKIN
jgi:AraC family transcriptional regulator